MRLPDDYRVILDGSFRPPSWMSALLPEGDGPPQAEQVRRLLLESTLRVGEIAQAEERLFPDSEWEFGVSVRFEDEPEPLVYQVGVAPAGPLIEYHSRWLGVREEEYAAARRSRWSVGVSCLFGERPLADFHRQVRVLAAAAPHAILVMDVAGCKPHPARWLRETASSRIPPSPLNLYVVHAVHDEGGQSWMHTHGLLRCGIVELEMLGVGREESKELEPLLYAAAAMLLDGGVPRPEEEFAVGYGMNLVWLPWQEGLRKLPEDVLGGAADRDESHSFPSGLLFAPHRGLLGRKHRPVSAHLAALRSNPVVYVSTLETERMTLLARERWSDFVGLHRRFCGAAGWGFLVKIGYPTDGAESESDREHLWFAVHGIDDDGLEATLENDPYRIARLKRGDRGRHPLTLLSDWMILTPKGSFTPDTIYQLERST